MADTTTGPATAKATPLQAQRFTHPTLPGRSLVRVVEETLAPAVDVEMNVLGFAPVGERTTVGTAKRRALGFPTWADYVLQDQMAKTPKTALGFMQQLGTPVAAEQRREAAELQAQIKATGGTFQLKPWDWDFYSEQVR